MHSQSPYGREWRVFWMEDNGTFVPLTSYGIFESYGMYKSMILILGIKEE